MSVQISSDAELATIELYRGSLSFSAGHFTIFSATEREYLHGHNYSLEVCITALLSEPGITFDYRLLRRELTQRCQQLHTHLLLPTRSPYLTIEADEQYYYALFNGQTMPFLKSDVILLPLSNITLEELSQWFIQELLSNTEFMEQHQIRSMAIKVFNGQEHSAMARWVAD